MRLRSAGLAALAVGICLSAQAFGMDVPMKYIRHPERTKEFMPYGTNFPALKVDLPAGDFKLPELVSDHPLYGLVRLGDREHLVVLDRKKKDDLIYNRLYFDADADGDLTDDPVIKGKILGRDRNYSNAEFPIVNMTIVVDGVSQSYSFRPRLSGYNLTSLKRNGFTQDSIGRHFNFYIMANCSYESTFEVDGKDYRIQFGDSNGNGRFDDRLNIKKQPLLFPRRPVFTQGDRFFMSDDGKVESLDYQVMGELLYVNGKLFEMTVDTKKSRLTLNEINNGLVPLTLTMDVDRLTLCTEDGSKCLNAFQPGKKIMVPEGSYKLVSYEAYRKDEQGDLWRLCASASKECPVVEAGVSGAEMTIGEPYAPLVDVQGLVQQNVRSASKRKARTSLSFIIEGAGKELLTDLSHVSGNKTRIPRAKQSHLRHRPKEAAYKIVTADGEVVTQGSFEYG